MGRNKLPWEKPIHLFTCVQIYVSKTPLRVLCLFTARNMKRRPPTSSLEPLCSHVAVLVPVKPLDVLQLQSTSLICPKGNCFESFGSRKDSWNPWHEMQRQPSHGGEVGNPYTVGEDNRHFYHIPNTDWA